MSEKPHVYFSGVGHFTAPDDEIFPCCRRPDSHPIHVPPKPELICDCPGLPFRHYYEPSLRCTTADHLVPHPHWMHPRGDGAA